MLGLLHRVVLGLAPEPLACLFPPMVTPRFPRDTRGHEHRHGRQLLDRCDGTQPPSFQRSLFGLVYVYNLLPQHVVDSSDVSTFQRRLQHGVKIAFIVDMPFWQNIFCDGYRHLSITQFQSLFASCR